MTVWILTCEFNRYDSNESFLKVFKNKPTSAQIRNEIDSWLINYTDEYIDHILKGGGRFDNEDVWYNLFEEELE